MSHTGRSQWPLCQVRGCDRDAVVIVEDGYWLCRGHVGTRKGVEAPPDPCSHGVDPARCVEHRVTGDLFATTDEEQAHE